MIHCTTYLTQIRVYISNPVPFAESSILRSQKPTPDQPAERGGLELDRSWCRGTTCGSQGARCPLEDDGDAANGNEAALRVNHELSQASGRTVENAYDVVVLAAHDVGGAGAAATDADDIDGGAGKADKHVEALDDDVEQTEDHGRIVISRLW